MRYFNNTMGHNYFYFLGAGATMVILLITILYYSKKRVKSEESIIYKYIVLTHFLIFACETVLYISPQFILSDTILKDVVIKTYVCLSEFWTSLLTVYTTHLVFGRNLDDKSKKKKKVLVSIAFIACLISWILTIVFKEQSFYNETHTATLYSIGTSSNMIFINGIFGYALIFYLLFFVNKFKIDNRFGPVLLYLVTSLLFMLLRRYNPSFSLMTGMTSPIIVYMYITFENPDIKLVNDLKEAKEKAENGNKEKTAFLSSMSHEIRTPLNTIYGLAEDNLVFESELPKDIIENCNDIMEASKNLLEIVDNIFDVNRIESNEVEIQDETYNIKEELISLCKIVSSKIPNDDVQLKLNISKDVPTLLQGDKIHIKEIISNILINAIKYTAQGTVNLIVKSENDYKNGIANLHIICRDTGKGMNKETLDNLFVDDDISVQGNGLVITKALIDLMGGTIKADSEEGIGSTFTIKLAQRINQSEHITINE